VGLTYDEDCKPVAARAKTVAARLKALHRDARDLIEFNAKQAIDWAAASTPAYLTESAAGDLDGFRFSRQSVANLLGTLQQIENLLLGATVSEGDHLANVAALADAGD